MTSQAAEQSRKDRDERYQKPLAAPPQMRRDRHRTDTAPRGGNQASKSRAPPMNGDNQFCDQQFSISRSVLVHQDQALGIFPCSFLIQINYFYSISDFY
jgi:hypothetical protein